MVAVMPAAKHHSAVTRRVERLSAVDGVELAIERFGDTRAPALVFAHGFGQTRQAWTDSAIAVARRGWHCITADARGHGESAWRDDGAYDFAQFIDDLVRIARVPADKPILVGASMGGLLGLRAQADHAAFRALVLVDITPRWETAGVERILTFVRAHPKGFSSIDEAADAIAHYLPHRAERKSPESLRRMLVSTADGRLRWHWDPRLSTHGASGESEQHLLEAARIRTRLDQWRAQRHRSDSTIKIPVLRATRSTCASRNAHGGGDANDALPLPSNNLLGCCAQRHKGLK